MLTTQYDAPRFLRQFVVIGGVNIRVRIQIINANYWVPPHFMPCKLGVDMFDVLLFQKARFSRIKVCEAKVIDTVLVARRAAQTALDLA